MAKREFQFIDGSSKKFWVIELSGKSHTVNFGRIGTSGQAQTKEFASEAEAQKSYDKLIAEKTKKGYAEVTATEAAAAPAQAPPAKVKKAEGEVKTQKAKGKGEEETVVAPAAAPIASVAAPVAAAAAPLSLNVERKVDLAPEDYQWRAKAYPPCERKPRPAAPPFDKKACLARLTSPKEEDEWPWNARDFPRFMTAQEAHFWLEAMIAFEEMERKDYHAFDTPAGRQALADKLAEMSFSGKVLLADFNARVAACRCSQASLVAHHLFTPQEMVELYAAQSLLAYQLGVRFESDVHPYLTDAELEQYRKLLRPRLDPALWRANYGDTPAAFHIAVLLDMHEEIRRLILSWQKGQGNPWYVYSDPDPAFIQEQIRRLGHPLGDAEQVRTWIAITGHTGVDYVVPSIIGATGGYPRGTAKEEAEAMTKALAVVKAPENAPVMLQLFLESKAPKPAKDWLMQNPAHAIPGLMAPAAGRGKMADAAIDFLREHKKAGHEKLIREAMKSAPAAAERVQRDVLDYVEKTYEPLDAKAMPKPLAAAMEKFKALKAKIPAWAAPAGLPPIVIGEKRLADEQVNPILMAMQKTTLDSPDTVLTALKECATRDSLDAFVWRLFELWLSEGAPSKEKWALHATGFLGSDAIAMKLTPLVRAWPGESQHQRAVTGLECLRAIGTDTALMCLNGIAQKLKFQGLKNKAKELMEAIAKDRGMSRAQLEDRIVPDCDLDERGTRIFDFGPRQFRFVLGPDMKPMVKDADNKVKGDLPAPNSKDDATKAPAAVEEWKLLKKQVKEVAKLQAMRLEHAMVTGRRWTLEEFETLLVKHPLMTNLTRLLVWAGYDAKGKLLRTFRVTEDPAYFDNTDKPIDLKGIAHVGIPHPLELGDEVTKGWGILGDYEIIPPFEQLGRPVYALEANEAKAVKLDRFGEAKIPGASLSGGLDKNGWIRGALQDHGDYYYHRKVFYSANVTAYVEYEPGLFVGQMQEAEEQTINDIYFVAGEQDAERPKDRLPLGKVEKIVISEVIKDLTALAAKAQ